MNGEQVKRVQPFKCLCVLVFLLRRLYIRIEREISRNSEITKFHLCTAHFLCMRNARRVIKCCFVSSAATLAVAVACHKV